MALHVTSGKRPRRPVKALTSSDVPSTINEITAMSLSRKGKP